MRGFFIAVAFGATSLVFGSIASSQEAETAVLQPAGLWQLDAGEERCRLARAYGTGRDVHILFMEQDEPGSWVGFAIAGHELKGINWDDSVALQFGTLPEIDVPQYSRGNVGEYEPALLINSKSLAEPRPENEREADNEADGTNGLPRIPTERFEGVEQLSVVQDGQKRVALALPNLKSALDALNLCSESFVSFWGLDLEQHRTMTRRVKWSNAMTIARRVQMNYPAAALRRGEQGTVRFIAIVDEEGKVTECRHSDVTQLDRLDSPVCKEMRRAEFEPALDSEGKPMKSYYAGRIRYVLP